jgi:hypothetical protein
VRRRWAVLALLLVLAVALVWPGPARILAPPRWLHLSCSGRVCTDDPARLGEASQLYAAAFSALVGRLGPAPEPRRMVFCATDACYREFGTTHATATTIADLGIVVGPHGWQDFYVRHELVHHWQAQDLGLLTRYRAPRWLIEGMAYSLSDDPRPVLVEPNQTYRARFQAWYATIAPSDLWPAARALAG